MTNPLFTTLRTCLPAEAIPWVTAALRQDALVWQALQNAEIEPAALQASAYPDDAFSPAALALQALKQPLSPRQFRVQPLCALDAQLLRRALAAYEAYTGAARSELTNSGLLAQAGLIALALRERRRLTGDWQGLSVELSVRPLSSWKTPLACLWGIIPDPLDLIHAILTPNANDDQIALAIHALLSNPAPPLEQVQQLNQLWTRTAPLHRPAILPTLAAQNPALAGSFARQLSDTQEPDRLLRPDPHKDKFPSSSQTLAFISIAWEYAERYQIAGQPAQALNALEQVNSNIHQFQATMNACTARAAALAGDIERAITTWKETLSQTPVGRPDDLANLVGLLLDAGRTSEARQTFELYGPQCQQQDLLASPSLLLTTARLAAIEGELSHARENALRALDTLAENQPIEHIQQLAHLLLDLGLPADAAKAAEIALRQRANNIDLLVLLGRAQLEHGEPQAASQNFTWAVMLAPERTDLHRFLATSLEHSNDWTAALAEWEVVSASSSSTPADRCSLANCALHAELPQRAAEASRLALQANPEDGAAHALLGEALAMLNDVPTACQHYAQATLLTPQLAKPWLALAQLLQTAGQPQKALETLRTATHAAPEAAPIHYALGEACLAANAPTQALAAFQRAADLDPTHTATQFHLGQTLQRLGQFQQARQVFGKIYIQNTDIPGLASAYAHVLLSLNDRRAAIPVLAHVLQAAPSEPAPYLDYARALLQLNEQIPDAVQALRKAIEISPLFEAQALLAEALAASGDMQAAALQYRTCLDSIETEPPTQEIPWRARLSLGLGQAALALKQYDMAIAALQESAQANPKDATPHRLLATIYLAVNLPQDALLAARTALNLGVDDFDTLVWFADQALKFGEHFTTTRSPKEPSSGSVLFSEALNALSRASQMKPQHAGSHLRLAQVQLKIGDTATASNTLRRVAEAKTASAQELAQAAGLLLTLHFDTNIGLVVTCLERAVLISQEEGDAPNTAHLLADLAHAYELNDQPAAALDALDRAIPMSPGTTTLYQAKAELLLDLKQPQKALACLEDAIIRIPGDTGLHHLAAIIARLQGNLPHALDHAIHMIHLASIDHAANLALATYSDDETRPPKLHPQTLAARLLAADLARALLQPDAALSFVENPWSAFGDDQSVSTDMQLLLCVKAELALEKGEEIEAAKALNSALGKAASSEMSAAENQNPRIMALQARFANRRGDATAALPVFHDALYMLSNQTQHTNRNTSSDYLAVAEAAIELNLWDSALALIRQAITISPAEPAPHLALARTLTLEAEYQQLCEDVGVTTHAPGQAALGTDVRQSFEQAMQTITGQFRQWDLPAPTPTPADPSAASPTTISLPGEVLRWQGRGAAVFIPSLQNAQFLAISPTASLPEDVAACLAALRRNSPTCNEAASRAIQNHPQHWLVLLQAALALATTAPAAALPIAQTASNLAPAPGVPGVFYPIILAQIASKANQVDVAQQAIQAALLIWPDEPRWRALAAEIDLALGQPKSAINHLEDALRLEAGYVPHYLALGYLLLENASTVPARSDLPYIKRALRLFEKACRITPNQSEPWLAMAHAHRLNGSLGEATACAERAAALASRQIPQQTPWQTEALITLAEIALQADDPQTAIAHAQAAASLQSHDAAPVLILARAFERLNQTAEALAVLEEATAQAREPISLQVEIVRLVRQSRGLAAALSLAQEMAQKYPHAAQALATLARYQAEGGQNEEAMHTAQVALQIAHAQPSLEAARKRPSRTGALIYAGLALDAFAQAELHHLLGRLLRQAGQLDQAIYQLNQAIRKAPVLLEPYLELGRAHQDRRQHLQALHIYRQATAVAPQDPRPFYQAGLALKEGKDYSASEHMLRRAAELAPDDLRIRKQLAAVAAINLVHSHHPSSIQ